jgi:hypothetical protein
LRGCRDSQRFHILAFRWQDYANRPDLVANRESSLAHARLPEIELHRWLRKATKSSDVILAEPGASFFVSAAGRKVVALQELFSNPYVNLEPRLRDSTEMFQRLHAGRKAQFLALAEKYRVRYLAVRAPGADKLRAFRWLRRVFRSKDRQLGYDVFRVKQS